MSFAAPCRCSCRWRHCSWPTPSFREEPLAGLGFAPAVTAEAFTMEQGKVTGMLRTNQGFAFVTLTEIKPSYAPKLDEVKDKVRKTW